MRKSLFFSIILSVISILLFTSKVNALNMYLQDQSQQNFTGKAPVYSEYQTNQTFKVTKNVLTKIAIGMRDRKAGASISLIVKDENTGQTIVTKAQRMEGGDGWEIFDLVDNEVGYKVDITHRFSMWVSTLISTDPIPSWLFTTDSSAYSKGYRRGGLIDLGGDHVFLTYGYDLVEDDQPVIPVIEIVEEEEEEEEDATPSDEASPTEEETDSSPEVQPLDTGEEDIVLDIQDEDVEDSVKVPTIEMVLINDVEEEFNETVNLFVEDILNISGNAQSGDTVLITIGEKIFAAIADIDGKWSLVIDISALDTGEYSVYGQAKDSDGKVSQKIEFFDINVSDIDDEIVVTNGLEQENTKTLPFELYIIFGGIFLLIVFLVLYFVIRKRKGLKEKTSEIITSDPDLIKDEAEKSNK